MKESVGAKFSDRGKAVLEAKNVPEGEKAVGRTVLST